MATDIDSATQIASASDLTNVRYFYHTMHNRQAWMTATRHINRS